MVGEYSLPVLLVAVTEVLSNLLFDLFELGETQTDREVIEMSLLQLGEYLTQLLASRPLGHEPDHLFDEFEIIAICK